MLHGPCRGLRARRRSRAGASAGERLHRAVEGTLQVIVKDPDTLVGGGHVLAVVRVGKRDACLAAAVDVSANKEANALAREAADTIARTFACGKDKPRVSGAATRWTEVVIGVDGTEGPRR